MRGAALLLTASVLVTTTSYARAGDAKPTKLEGTWRKIDEIASGVRYDPKKWKSKVEWRFKGNRCTMLVDGQWSNEYAFKIDDSKSPATITMVPIVSGKPAGPWPRKIATIYRIADGKLHICRDMSGLSLPKEFTGEKNSGQLLTTFERSR